MILSIGCDADARTDLYNSRFLLLENNLMFSTGIVFYFCLYVCRAAASSCFCRGVQCICFRIQFGVITDDYRVDHWIDCARLSFGSVRTDTVYQVFLGRFCSTFSCVADDGFLSYFTCTSVVPGICSGGAAGCCFSLSQRRNGSEKCPRSNSTLYFQSCAGRDGRACVNRLYYRSLFLGNCLLFFRGNGTYYFSDGLLLVTKVTFLSIQQ